VSGLLDAVGHAPFIFVVGKGGVGKTTTAGALSLALADRGTRTHLISTDPAHSLADLFQHAVGGEVVASPCSDHLHIEEFEAERAAAAWLERALEPVAEIIERGTYLDADDVTAFSRLALPGIDEMMAVLRLTDLADTTHVEGDRRVVVDTAPTGHTLRLLDAAAAHEAIARALRAMADKATAVAGAMTGRGVRMRGEDVIDQLDGYVAAYRERVLGPAAFVVATRPGAVIEAETVRLIDELRRRHLRVAAIVSVGGRSDAEPRDPRPGTGGDAAGSPGAAAPLRLCVPVLSDVAGCAGLRAWHEHVGVGRGATAGPGPPSSAGPGPSSPPIQDWLDETAPRLLLFAGKGGVGKSTCAAAAALALAGTRDVVLCSTDPAGSLADVLGPAGAGSAERLRVVQAAPAEQLERLRDSYREDVVAALERVGLSQSATLDRRVIESLWDLAPPGVDELAATASILTVSASHETIVIDSSPTGHFLRLLEMPDIALGWTRQLMRVFVKYGIAGVAGRAAESLIELSHELKALREALHDGTSAAVIVVTLDEPMVRAETERLVATLDAAHIRVAAVLVNRSAPSFAGTQEGDSGYDGAGAVVRAAELDPSPVGEDGLRRFIDTWNIVA
jgi:arsenite-transporting ATPase